MEKQQAPGAAIKPVGMCEKLYNAFQPTRLPLRRLTFRQQDATTAPADSSPAVPRSKLPEPAAPPQGKKDQLPKAKKSTKLEPLPTPAPPKAEVRPVSTLPQPLPPPPLSQPKVEVKKPVKGINERVDDYISRTKGKIRSVSGVGRAPSTKMK